MSRIKICDSTGSILKYLYQWDTNQNVVISGIEPNSVTEVHFSHVHSDDAFVIIPHVTDSGIVAPVPNILLQQATSIMLYIVYDSDASSSRTIGAIKIAVVPRAKPVDYMYTETEVLNYRTLEAQLKELEDEINGEAFNESVRVLIKEYLASEITNAVKTVNGAAPDENGNVEINALPDSTEQISMLIEADMLSAVHDASGAILTDEKGNIILRY